MSVQLSIVVPVFRSELSLPELYQRLVLALEEPARSFEILFVEDGGGDGAWDVITKLANLDSRVRGIRLGRNYGQHNALLCGIRAAKGELIVTIDDDLQNPPEEIPHLLAHLEKGYDVVYGRPARETHGLLRDIASRVTKIALQESMGVESASQVSSFRVFRAHLRRAFESYRSPSVNIDVLLTWGTTRFSSVRVRQDARALGDSGYGLKKLVTHALNMVTGFSILPLQVASVLGLVFGTIGVGIMLYVLGRFFIFGSSVPGFTFLASIIAIFSGVQLFALGIFGEYLARMHFRAMERPPYIESDSTAAPG
ncbi:glycosyltransferase family 2 protein [Ramlibacter sp. AN1015]|uniref:glycosyltransferase family 2 protein n=1 Tax=Ramlibacter sp. AN1015 TaxID=3133428 RepID=UPI0030C205BE